jgi:hypothetical protein
MELHDALAMCSELPWRRARARRPGGGGPPPPPTAGGPVLEALASSCPRPSAPAIDRRMPRPRVGLRLAALTAAALTLAIASSAHAEEVFTSQAAAARATDSTWIPAPTQRAAVCIVDTGNDPNPDTSNVIARLSVDGEPGTDRSPTHHGTLMSMIAAAPYNGFGMVGAAPSINIVSVRASRDGTTFGGTDLAAGIQLCLAYRNTYNIKVISLSLGGAVVSGLDAGSMATIEDIVDSAHIVGLDVVAAAGNHQGAVDWPAGYAAVLAIGAESDLGARCGFAAAGPEIDLWAPGCPLDAASSDGTAAWASGSSEATAFVAGVLAQMRQLLTNLTPGAAEQALTANARVVAAGRSLDVAASFAAAGLTDALASGQAAAPLLRTSSDDIGPVPVTMTPASSSGQTAAPVPGRPDVTPPAVSPEPAASSTGRRRLPKPSARFERLRHGRVILMFRNRPAGIDARVQIYGRGKASPFPVLVRSLRIAGDRLRTTVSRKVVELSITYRDPTMIRDPSVVLSLHPGK